MTTPDTPKRKPGRPKGTKTVAIYLRIPETQYPDYLKRGGAKWLKGLITTFLVRK